MKGTLEKLRRMFIGRKDADDDITLSRFARSTSFKKASMRRSQRRQARKKAVVTNRGIYYVDDDSGGDENAEPGKSSADANGTLGSESAHSQGTISYTDWIQISDDDTLDKSKKSGDRKKSSASRNFSLEGKSVPFDSPLPGEGKNSKQPNRAASPVLRQWGGEKNATQSEDPPVVSTFGSSCTSGVHSMEKPLACEGGRGGARRRAPTVVATRDQLRRSIRRISGRRVKKSARRTADADSPASIMDQEFYRRFAKLPLVLNAGGESPGSPASASADLPSPLRTPFAFSRQNPITRWLEESEQLQRRSAVLEEERPLWSELVNKPPRPAGADAGRKANKPKSRSSRTRTPSRKSLRRKLKQARARVDVEESVGAAVASAEAEEQTSVQSPMPVSSV